MNVGQLKKALEKIPDDVKIDMPDGTGLDVICYNEQHKRIDFDTEDAAPHPDNLNVGWRYLEIPK